MLEKDLIFEEVTRLLERTKKKVDSGKEDTLKLAKKVRSLLCFCSTITFLCKVISCHTTCSMNLSIPTFPKQYVAVSQIQNS